MIHAIMGCAGVGQLTMQMKAAGQYIAPEFSGKRVGLVLQKVLKSKNDGSDTYGLDIRMPFLANTHQTLLEQSEGKNPEAVNKDGFWIERQGRAQENWTKPITRL